MCNQPHPVCRESACYMYNKQRYSYLWYFPHPTCDWSCLWLMQWTWTPPKPNGSPPVRITTSPVEILTFTSRQKTDPITATGIYHTPGVIETVFDKSFQYPSARHDYICGIFPAPGVKNTITHPLKLCTENNIPTLPPNYQHPIQVLQHNSTIKLCKQLYGAF